MERDSEVETASRYLEIHLTGRGCENRDLVLGIKVEVEAKGDHLGRGLLLLRRPKVEF